MNETYVVTANAALRVTNVSAAAHGSVSLGADGRTVTYTPALNYNGPDSFTYTANDGSLASASTVTVSLTVTPVNDAPSCSVGSFTATEDTSRTGSLASLCEDVDSGDTRTYRKGSDPANGTVVVNTDGSFTYTPAPNFTGPDLFTFLATDAAGADSNTAAFAITVTPVNVNDTQYASIDRVDGYDLVALAIAFGSNSSRPNWNPLADLNHDGVVDGADLAILASHFGEVQQ